MFFELRRCVLLPVAPLREQPYRRRDQENQESQGKDVPHQSKENEIDKQCQKPLSQNPPGLADSAIHCGGRRTLEDMLSISGDELIQSLISFGKKVVGVS